MEGFGHQTGVSFCGNRWLDRVAEAQPLIVAALQRPYSLHSSTFQLQRHTGASGFVWSSAVEDYIAVARNLCKVGPQFGRTQNTRALELEPNFLNL